MRKSTKVKEIPKFKSEDEEHEFWATHDATDFFDFTKAILNPAMPNLKPSTETISIRLPKGMLDRIKMMANQKDMPYQSLMKHMLAEKVAEATPPYSAAAAKSVTKPKAKSAKK